MIFIIGIHCSISDRNFQRPDNACNRTPRYIDIIISKNTTSSSRFADEEQWEEDIEDAFVDYFSNDDLDTLKTFIGYNKLSRDYTNFGDYKYQEVSFSVDFGYTYIR